MPGEPITEYNLGVLYKAAGRADDANSKFALAASLDPNFAAPHFQLFNYHRQQGQSDKAKAALARFQELKRLHEESGTGNEDVEWSLYSEIYEAIDSKLSADSTAAVPLRFAATALPGKADPATASLLVVDLDGSGSGDLLVVSSSGITAYRKGITPLREPALEALSGVISAAPGDYDNDGLTDLCVLTTSGAVLLHGTKGGFEKAPVTLPAGRFDGALWIDYDHDYDADLILYGAQTRLVRNQLPDGFAERPDDIRFAAGKAIAAVETRVIPDTKSHDFVIAYADHPAVLYKDRLAGVYAPQPIEAVPAGAGRQLQMLDLDNDSAPDLVWDGGAALNLNGHFKPLPWTARSGAALADFENRGLLDVAAAGAIQRGLGAGKWASAQPAAGLPANAQSSTAVDFDGDGRTDLAVVLADGSVQRLLNQTPLKNNWTRIRLTGVKNLKLGYGSEVEVKAGPFYQKQFYRGVPLTFGLRQVRDIDTIRITWPNGLIQNETKQKANAAVAFQEAQRLSGSCPVIWTWNGSEFTYITDVLGIAPLGASSGDGSYFVVDHDEYISIAAEQLRAVNGRLPVRITEELSEVSYLDQVQLIAVDHPAATEIYTNEKWKSPPYPDFRLFGVERRIQPVRARDERGRDMLERVLRRDQRYADGFRRDMQSVAAPHALELDFGKAAPDNDGVLVLNGWLDWADGSTFLAQSQATRTGLQPPSLQVRNARGQWQTVIEDMGMPDGKPKTIAVDLKGKFLTDSREIRIVTNLCVFWDEIFLSQGTAAPAARLTHLAPLTADLHFRGFAQNIVHPQRLQPELFLYADPAPASSWNPTPGLYTRYGDVLPLLGSVDDKLLVMGSGDEVALDFDAARLPALPQGWRRDWLLKVDGWAKDRDANTAYSQTVEPLPFHGMSSYPYPAAEHFPDTPEMRDYRKQYNNRPALRLLRALNRPGTDSRR